MLADKPNKQWYRSTLRSRAVPVYVRKQNGRARVREIGRLRRMRSFMGMLKEEKLFIRAPTDKKYICQNCSPSGWIPPFEQALSHCDREKK